MQPAGIAWKMILLAEKPKFSVGEVEVSGISVIILRDTDRVCHKNRKLHSGKIGPLKIDR